MPASTPASSQAAIAAALGQNWKEAIRINTALIKVDKNDLDALNRLAFAHLKIGELTKAKKMYQKVLTVDPYNQIGLKNLKKLGSLKKKNTSRMTNQPISPLLFLEEPGKTKIVTAINLAPLEVLSALTPGQEVFLKAKNHVVEIRDLKQTYLGALPDDLSFRLIRLLAAGNRYQVVIKSSDKNSLTAIIRETFRGKRFAHHPSFAPTTSYVPFSQTHMSDTSDMAPTTEEEEEKAESES